MFEENMFCHWWENFWEQVNKTKTKNVEMLIRNEGIGVAVLEHVALYPTRTLVIGWTKIPEYTMKVHTQHTQKINVWARIFGDQDILPFCIPYNLNRELLQDVIDPATFVQLNGNGNCLAKLFLKVRQLGVPQLVHPMHLDV